MKISICMPYWQRQSELDRSLAAYRRLYGHLDIEISICDDGTPVPVRAPGCVVTRLKSKRIGLNPCVPINAAVRASSGDVIVLTNPEVEHREDVLTGMLAMLEHPDDYVTVACQDVSGMWIAGPMVNYLYENGRMPVPPNAHFHFCAMFHRELFDRAGGFDEEYRFGRSLDDNDWLWSVAEAGARFKVAPGQVWHYKTPHSYAGSHLSNLERLKAKWGHKWAPRE